MNHHERIAWRSLVDLGAKVTEIGGKHALDLSTIRIRSRASMVRFCTAFAEVTDRSGHNRREMGRVGVYIVTDDVHIVTDDKENTKCPG
jgi:hypothetical protein